MSNQTWLYLSLRFIGLLPKKGTCLCLPFCLHFGVHWGGRRWLAPTRCCSAGSSSCLRPKPAVTPPMGPICLHVIMMCTVQDMIASPWLRCPKTLLMIITTHYCILLQSLSPVSLPESWITKCCSNFEARLRDTSGKGDSVILPITSILGPGPRRLPAVRAGDAGTIQLGYCSACRKGAHCYNHDLANTDSSSWADDGCPMYFVNSWALGWSLDPWSAIKSCVWPREICFYTLLHIILYYLHWIFLHIITLSIFTLLIHIIIMCYYKNHNYVLLHRY